MTDRHSVLPGGLCPGLLHAQNLRSLRLRPSILLAFKPDAGSEYCCSTIGSSIIQVSLPGIRIPGGGCKRATARPRRSTSIVSPAATRSR
jgi:hypothetical protein